VFLEPHPPPPLLRGLKVNSTDRSRPQGRPLSRGIQIASRSDGIGEAVVDWCVLVLEHCFAYTVFVYTWTRIR
jgi:hypothetical protein